MSSGASVVCCLSGCCWFGCRCRGSSEPSRVVREIVVVSVYFGSRFYSRSFVFLASGIFFCLVDVAGLHLEMSCVQRAIVVFGIHSCLLPTHPVQAESTT